MVPLSRPRQTPARTPEMDVEPDDLIVDFRVLPAEPIPVGTLIKFQVKVQYRGPGGALADWPLARLQVLYRGKTYGGVGPHRVLADLVAIQPGEVPVAKLRVGLWSEQRKRWNGTDVATLTTTTYCNANVAGLDEDARLLTCLLFAEGGSEHRSQRKLKGQELHAIAWSVRNRLALIDRALNGSVGGGAKEDRRRADVLKYIGKQATYLSVISHPYQYSGYQDERYKTCAEPEVMVPDTPTCQRVHACMRVAQEVIVGRVEDPYASHGHPEFLGAFYYMTKTRYEELKKAGRKVPDTNKLPAFDASDRHHYWGLQSHDPFEAP